MNKDNALEALRKLAIHYRETFEATTYNEVTIKRCQFNGLMVEVYRHDGAMNRRKVTRRRGEGDGADS